MPDFELMDRVLDQISKNPKTWDQTTWRRPTGNECGTAMCFAGWVADLSGAEWYSNTAGTVEFAKVDVGGVPVWVDEYATAALGIKSWEAEQLFESSNTLDDLREIVEDLKIRYAPTPFAVYEPTDDPWVEATEEVNA